MNLRFSIALCLFTLLTTISSASHAAEHQFGTLGGVHYQISMPPQWNGVLIVDTHGLAAPSSDAIFLSGKDDAYVNALLAQGYAVAATAYRENGFVVKEAMLDVLDLTDYFSDPDRLDDQGRPGIGAPDRTLLMGCSLGTVVAGKLLEDYPEIYDGGFFRGHPGAGFPKSLDIVLDFSVAYATVFDWPEDWGEVGDLRDDLVFSEDVIPVIGPQLAFLNTLPKPLEEMSIAQLKQALSPAELDQFARWEFIRSIVGNPLKTFYDERTVNIHGSNGIRVQSLLATEVRADIEKRFGGPAASNAGRIYSLSLEQIDYLDSLGLDPISLLVEMNLQPAVVADPAARQELLDLGFSGEIQGPVISLHSVHDWASIVQHEKEYLETVTDAGREDLLLQVYSDYASHCAFTTHEIETAIETLDLWVTTGQKPAADFLGKINFPLPGYVPADWPQE